MKILVTKYSNNYGGPAPCLNASIEAVDTNDIDCIYQFSYSDSDKSLIFKTALFRKTKLSDFSVESNKYLVALKGFDNNKYTYVLRDELTDNLKQFYKVIDVDKEVIEYV